MTRSWILLCLLAGSACVPKQRLLDQEAKTGAEAKRAVAAEAKAGGLEKDLDALRKDFDAFKLSAQQTTEAGQKIQLDLGNQVKSASDQIANLQKTNKDIQQALDAKKGELSKQVAELIKERDGLKAQLIDRDKQAASLSAQVSEKDKQLAGLRVQSAEKDARLASLGAEAADLRTKLAAAEAEKKALADAKQQLEAAKQAELELVKQNYEQLNDNLKNEISAGQVTITQLKGKLTVNLVEKILFDPGQADVKSDGKKVLDKLGQALNGVADKDIRIEGHTDNKPITSALQSKYPTNWELSTARATTVARYLQDRAKVDGKRVIAAGYGEFRPISSNDTPEGRAQNRRIEIVLVPRD